MVVNLIGPDGALPLPWLRAPLAQALASERSHALLLRAAPGAGALALALSLAQSRLCEAPRAGGLACGQCGACRLVQAQGHPDLFVLLPELERRESGWLLAANDKPETDDAKRKASRQIRIDEVRGLLDWVSKTSSRGRGKMVVLHPAEALNAHAASALLKTVEEPPAGTRIVLTCSDTMHVMATVRSRCQHLTMPLPDAASALAWLEGQGVAQPQALLGACDGRPLEVLAWQRAGVDAAGWSALPRQLAAGRAGVLARLGVPLALELLLKVCHDAMALSVGGSPRYFDKGTLPAGAALSSLMAWQGELVALARAAEHPWHEGLAIDALVSGAERALLPRRSRAA